MRPDVWPLFGRLVLTGWTPHASSNLRIQIDGEPTLATVGHDAGPPGKGRQRAARTTQKSPAVPFAALSPILPEGRRSSSTSHVVVSLDGRVAFSGHLPLRGMSVFDLAESAFLRALHDCLGDDPHSPACEIMAPRIQCRPAEALGPYEIEASARSGSAIVVSGWIANIGHRRLHVVGEDLQNFVPHEEIVIRTKPDLHLSGSHTCDPPDAHGFLFVLPETRRNGSYFIVESDPRAGTSVFYGPFAKPAGQDEALAAKIASAPFGTVFATPPPLAERLYRPLITPARPPISPRQLDFGPAGAAGGTPDYSIIVPLFGDAFFLSSVFHLQRILDARFELIVVVDDPPLWPRVATAFENRKTFIRTRTKLLRLNSNFGYGIANNAGAAAASGDVLFLMNSDVLVRSAGPLLRAGETIGAAARQHREIVAGFSLLFEDETIQHVGIAFARAPSLHGLYLAEHPMKGLPIALHKKNKPSGIQAVTGALLGISADLFRRLGGFDPAYERADFEDADLCLRAVEAGAEVHVFAESGLYHLEGQSVSRLGPEARQALTYLNCIEFNRRWADRLDRLPRVRKQKRATPQASLAIL